MRAHHSIQSDTALLDAVRRGDQDAYGRLWERHAPAVRAAATSFTGFDADDVTAETFTRILRSISRGFGPQHTFRSYAIVTARNIAAEWARGQRETPLDEFDDREDPALAEFSSTLADDRSLAARAFQTLPDRWQEALWYSEIEAMRPAEIAPLLGMKPNAVAALTVRAREGLRQAWIQLHLDDDNVADEHKWVIVRASKYARGKLPSTVRRTVDTHLANCPDCRGAYLEVEHASSRIALVLLPLAIGPAGAEAYAAWVRKSGSTPSNSPTAQTRHMTSREGLLFIGTGTLLAAGICGAAVALSAPEATTWASPKPSTSITPQAPPPAASIPDPAAATDTHQHHEVQQPLPPIEKPKAPTQPYGVVNLSPATPEVATAAPRAPLPAVLQAPTPTPHAAPEPTPHVAPAPTPPGLARLAPPTVTLLQSTDDAAPTLFGTADPGAVVTTKWSPATGTPVTSRESAAKDGTWRQLPPDTLSPGQYTVLITQTSPAGQTTSAPVIIPTTVRPSLSP